MLLSSSVFLVLLASISAGPLLFKPQQQQQPVSKQTCNSGLECRDGDTCCEVKSGGWSCCPFKNATCCKDKLHCCPGDTHCNLTSGYCEKKKQVYPIPLMSLIKQRPKLTPKPQMIQLDGLSLPMTRKTIAEPVSSEKSISRMICPDRETTCNENNTCCPLGSGDYSCCPLMKAVCCSDQKHCCPNGYHCDVKARTCLKDAPVLPMLKHTAGDDGVVCPDKQSTCPSGNTCCILSSGDYGCCPLPAAVCCSDHTHCCPNGYTCNVSGGTCNKGTLSLKWFEKTKATVESVICPDGSSTCPTGNTCCKLASGQYGCCPLPKATCCSDHTHCCPEGYTCHPSEGTCTTGTLSIPWVKKTSGSKKVTDVVCPDGSKTCPDNNTCCKLSSGKYGCCSLPNAVCCSDHAHCCPQGYTCHPSEGTCTQGITTIPWIKKTSAIKIQENTDVSERKYCSSAKQTLCDTNKTCCKDQEGGYKCCPKKNGTCCQDRKHCCSQGMKCVLHHGKMYCEKQETTAVRGVTRTKSKTNFGNIICPGQKYQCADGNTCCKTGTGEYSCCPLPHAVCCKDFVHCCPTGYACNGKAQCEKDGEPTISWVKKRPALRREILKPAKLLLLMPWSKKSNIIESVVCPDGASECPNGNTCCKLSSGQYGCCPLPQAVCCADHVHCCPSGYTCDVSSGQCSRGSESITWFEKNPARYVGSALEVAKVSASPVNGVVCPDGASECPNGNTCCKLASGQYGCCPLPKAVCCTDHVHCCPSGYTCDVSSGQCSRGSESITWFEKNPARSVGSALEVAKVSASPVNGVVCPDGASECPNGNTCCKLASGQYGCCPLPQAVCCTDHVHCCPSGYTCDVSSGQCSRGSESITWFEKNPARSVGSALEVAKVSASPVNGVVCPDGASECPNGNTCCKLSSGQYGCCPLPQAVCCTDHVHCCPSRYTCDVSSGQCSRGSESITWFEKNPARSVGSALEVAKVSASPVNGVVCPDGASECPNGNTCCKLASGQYGCCPLPKAVCCTDHVHCCPSGYTCDVSSGQCSRGSESITWFEKNPARSVGSALEVAKVSASPVNGVVCPDGASECPNGNTCCKLASGQYGCCPLPQAVCCADHTHCCPHGYTCGSGTCNKGDMKLPMLQKTQATPVNGVVCPDGVSQCPNGNTCCKLASGQYGCCPLPQAVCCADHTHCCPHGYTCDTGSGSCNKGDMKFPLLQKTEATPVNGVVCPDGASQCPDGNTCCKLASGQYGCCPLPNAVCCPDHVHCCPNGYTCDVSSGSCNKGLESIPWVQKSAAKSVGERNQSLSFIPKKLTSLVENVICPDGVSQCPDGNTCCKLASGQYGCCPLPQAVCCADHTHCCPHGYTCDTGSGSCNKGDMKLAWLQKTQATRVNGVVCPDGVSQCPNGNTCCKLASGQYGCCPLPQAVCCADHTHCCPHGYTCDTGSGSCNKGDMKLPWLQKSQAARVNDVVCPDGASKCQDDETCCKMASGRYACCQHPNAVCCPDHVHCCPSGSTCVSGSCNNGSESIPWIQKSAAKSFIPKKTISLVDNVICPDGISQCPDGNTCCKLASGQYGCCPLPQAVCCADHTHCCPHGYTCDTGSGSCNKGDMKLPMLQKTQATPINSVVCPDGVSQCPDGNTCCKLASGQYGCCPLPQAVCCADHTHCCPHGYTCDTGSGSCNKGDMKLPLLQKTEATPVNGVVCPDGASQCPDGNTCCKLASGQYGCCPLPNAVCCPDHVHCCPNGYTCDVSSGSCNKGLESIPWVQKSAAKSVGKRNQSLSFIPKKLTSLVENVICPDGVSQCPDGNTCCKLASGQYGCCPLPQAVCCADHTHCCPHGYTCGSGTCNKGDMKLPWLQKTQATPVNSVVCPDGASQCPDGNTCCKLASGQYGCCPLPNAVCCPDDVHCCPNGYTCDVSSGSCNKGLESIPWVQKSAAKSVGKRNQSLSFIPKKLTSLVENVICPDGVSQCPDGNTCCKLASGQYGCCPLPQAVCCADHIHCCPHGYTCGSGTCNKGDMKLPLLQKTEATPVNGVVCPDGASQCPDGNTCCKLASGQYGCCPLPNAVCCPDHVHCCPNGYTCDVSSGQCSRGSISSPWVKKFSSVKKVSAVSLSAVICPDSASECPDGSTCCIMSGGEYGCCPMPMAVCCQDKVHCCPQGYTCDVSAGTCIQENQVIPWYSKTKAVLKDVICPDGSSSCPTGNTCCKLASGQYGCCPLPKATCCSDHTHCCPEGYTCHPSEGTCTKSPVSLPFIKHELTGRSVLCPDKRGTCPDGNTCCRLATGQYGCCPLPKATCCSDHTHCCPHGTTCDVAAGKCNKGDLTIPWLQKTQTLPVVNGVVCPDGASQCPSGNTCCKLSSGQYGCCPLPQAVCCADHVHCCPNGYTCDVSSGSCNKSFKSIPWLKKSSARNIN